MDASAESCTWCERAVPSEDGFRAYSGAGAGATATAVFCRLEHVVPWVIAARPWAAEGGPTPGIERPQSCSQCGAALGPDQLLLVRHRAAHRITDSFCDRAELGAWAMAGGRWRT